MKRSNEWLEKAVYIPIGKFMETGIYEVRDLNSMIFNYLKKGGLINFSEERESKITEKAKQEFYNKHKRQHEVQSINELITKMQDGNKDIDGLIELIKNKMMLQAFLMDCKELNRDILTEIKDLT